MKAGLTSKNESNKIDSTNPVLNNIVRHLVEFSSCVTTDCLDKLQYTVKPFYKLWDAKIESV